MATPQPGPDGGLSTDATAPAGDLGAEAARLREELRLLREELAQVRAENEKVLEGHHRVTRARRKAVKESTAMSRALAEVLFRELRDKVAGGGGKGRRARALLKRDERPVTQEEWQQVLLIHQSPYFKPAWYLRQNLTVARRGIEPALHFLRHGALELRDPGPEFDIRDYLERHPDVRVHGENPVLHALAAEATGSAPVAVRHTS